MINVPGVFNPSSLLKSASLFHQTGLRQAMGLWMKFKIPVLSVIAYYSHVLQHPKHFWKELKCFLCSLNVQSMYTEYKDCSCSVLEVCKSFLLWHRREVAILQHRCKLQTLVYTVWLHNFNMATISDLVYISAMFSATCLVYLSHSLQ